MLPAEVLENILFCLDRSDLDALQLVSGHLNGMVSSGTLASSGPLRLIDTVMLTAEDTLLITRAMHTRRLVLEDLIDWLRNACVKTFFFNASNSTILHWFLQNCERFGILELQVQPPFFSDTSRESFFHSQALMPWASITFDGLKAIRLASEGGGAPFGLALTFPAFVHAERVDLSYRMPVRITVADIMFWLHRPPASTERLPKQLRRRMLQVEFGQITGDVVQMLNDILETFVTARQGNDFLLNVRLAPSDIVRRRAGFEVRKYNRTTREYLSVSLEECLDTCSIYVNRRPLC